MTWEQNARLFAYSMPTVRCPSTSNRMRLR